MVFSSGAHAFQADATAGGRGIACRAIGSIRLSGTQTSILLTYARYFARARSIAHHTLTFRNSDALTYRAAIAGTVITVIACCAIYSIRLCQALTALTFARDFAVGCRRGTYYSLA